MTEGKGGFDPAPLVVTLAIVGFFVALGSMFGEGDGDTTPAEPTPADFRLAAENACWDAIEAQAKDPTEVDFGSFDTILREDAQYVVTGRVKLMNSIGAMIPHTYRCTALRGRVTGLKVGES